MDGWLQMAGVESGRQAADDDAAARQAAEVAVELSEAEGPADKKRITRALQYVAGRGADAVRRGSGAARRGAGSATGTVARTAGGARKGAGSAGRGVASGLTWLTDDEIAGLLVERAARATATVGGATGACAALPVLPAFPVEVAAETLAVVGIEIKLLAELHEVYGMPATGSASDRARAYIGAWASRRGVYQVDGGLLLIAGSPLARQLARRLAARVRRSAFSLSPLLTGALAGALLNRRETRRLGRQIRDELRSRRKTFTVTVIGRPTATPGV
jgi:hypothetical protein